MTIQDDTHIWYAYMHISNTGSAYPQSFHFTFEMHRTGMEKVTGLPGKQYTIGSKMWGLMNNEQWTPGFSWILPMVTLRLMVFLCLQRFSQFCNCFSPVWRLISNTLYGMPVQDACAEKNRIVEIAHCATKDCKFPVCSGREASEQCQS